VVASAVRCRGCADGWAADLQVRAFGPGAESVLGVTATVTDGADRRTVTLRRDGADWRGEVSGLPTGREVVVGLLATAPDGGTVDTANRRLAWACP
jgi:hypothetical protein